MKVIEKPWYNFMQLFSNHAYRASRNLADIGLDFRLSEKCSTITTGFYVL